MGGIRTYTDVEQHLQLIKLGYRFGKEGKLSLDQIEKLLRECYSLS